MRPGRFQSICASRLARLGLIVAGLTVGTCAAATQDHVQTPGPSSRRTGLVITEIMHHPRLADGGPDSEFVELFNSDPIPEDLGGYRLVGSIEYVFPSNTALQPGSYLVIARSPADLASACGITNVIGPFRGSLRGNSGRVQLENEFGAVLLETRFETTNPWPIAAAGAGHSMVLAQPSHGEGDPQAWTASSLIGGSPGGGEPRTPDPLAGVIINEFLLAGPSAGGSFVELYNHSNEPRDLSGSWLTVDPASPGFRIPEGTVLEPRGHGIFTPSAPEFPLHPAGGRILLFNAGRQRVVDAIEYEPQEPGVPGGRYPDGAPEFYRLARATPAAGNAIPLPSPVVINEIMYHPISGSDRDQYVELANRTTNSIDLSDWRFVRGIAFTFPPQTILPPNGFIVVAKDARRLRSDHPDLNKRNCLGNFDGALSRGGERVALARPVKVSRGPDDDRRPDTLYPVINEVTYHAGGQWGRWSDGGGSSLELLDPEANTRRADNWRDSDETGKSVWTTVEFTGALDATLGHPASDSLHLYLLGEGECLVDDVEVVTGTGSNRISNPGFEPGLAGWNPQGALDQSSLERVGYTGQQSLHLRAGSRGDPGANRIRSAGFQPLTNRESVTLRCQARWLKGWPELLLRLQGGGAEAFGRLLLPSNLGTPGKRNSRWSGPAGPALSKVRHQPVLPAANQPVVVTAQADDATGLKSVTLRYRVDPSKSFTNLAMNDEGQDGDAVAGDGIFSAAIPGQPAGSLVAFHVAATNQLDLGGTFPRELFPTGATTRLFPGDSLSHECLVRFGEPTLRSGFATYRLWLTQANRNRWIERDPLHNADVDVTFVYDDERVVYCAGAQTAGSPWHTDQMATGPDGTNRFDYVVHLPKDQPILGETDFNLVIPGYGDGPNSSDLSALSEPVSLLVFRDLGLPSLHRRFIHFFVNGTERSAVSGLPGHFVYEDVQQPNGRTLHEWFPGETRGQLFKVEDWFEFTNAVATGFENKDADLVRRVLPGTTSLNPAPYRFMWRLRGIQSGQSANDYGDFFRLINAISPEMDPRAPADYARVNAVADLEEWIQVFACQRTLGNWDSYGWDRGKNCYLYRPPKGRFVLIPWDVDATLALGGKDPNSDLFESSDPRITALLAVPEVKRMYLRTFQEILDGPLRPGRLESAFDVRAAALTANGVNSDPSLTVANKAYLAARRSHLAGELSRYRVPFSIETPTNRLLKGASVTLRGTAPLAVTAIRVDSQSPPVVWNTPTNWSLTVSLQPGTNVFEIAGLDRRGETAPGHSARISLVAPDRK